RPPLVQAGVLAEQHVAARLHLDRQRRQQPVGRPPTPPAHDHQPAPPGPGPAPRPPAQETRRLPDAHHVRPGSADCPGRGPPVVAQRADVVAEQPHAYTRRRAKSAAPTNPASGPRWASLTSATGRKPRPVSERWKVSRAGTISRSPASDTPPPMTNTTGSMIAARLASPRPSHWPIVV